MPSPLSAAGERPLVCLLFPTFNEPPPALRASLSSVVSQTSADSEDPVIGDSIDPDMAQACESLYREGARPRNHKRPQRLCQRGALTFGPSLAQGVHIARADGDDLQAPCRLERQVEFLGKRLEIGDLGCALRAVDFAGVFRGVRFANPNEALVIYRQEATDRNAVNWNGNLRACLRHFGLDNLPYRRFGLAAVASWSATPFVVRRINYERTQLSRQSERVREEFADHACP